MSGGVDSSVAAYVLKKEGYEVIGVTMCLGIPDATGSQKVKCCGAEAIEDAKTVCRILNVPHYVLDFSRQMNELIIGDFISEYTSGRTPNPCVRCNQYLKFGKLFDYAKEMEFDYLATGHYARITNCAGEFRLGVAADRKKDQTYFLYGIGKEKLRSILFPLGEYTKEQVRQIAQQARLPVANKAQSQDICFISGKSYKEFIAAYAGGDQTGEIVTSQGEVLGRHRGILNYTIGQREGLGVAVGRPLYVTALDPEGNRVIVGDKDDLYSSTVKVSGMNYLVDELPKKGLSAKIRYAHTPAECTFTAGGDQMGEVVFSESQEAVTPGQSLVLYGQDTVYAGGVIEDRAFQ